MQRMTGLDAAFLSMETEGRPMHTLKLLVLAPPPPSAPGPASRTLLEHGLRARMHLLPELRRRVVFVPAGLHHPMWIEEPTIELQRHLHQRTLAAPGDADALDAVVAEIAAAPLDRSRPLWEMWAIDGLAGGRWAVLVKIHHALADGRTAATLLQRVMTTAPDGVLAAAPPGIARRERAPSPGELIGMAAIDHLRQVGTLPALVRSTAARLRALRHHRRDAAERSPVPVLDAPRTSLNGALRAARSYASTTLPLKALVAIKNARGVPLNDVLLAIVAGALREYLPAHGGLPARPLIASVPTAAEHHELAPGGNHVWSLFVSLATDVEDPRQRLRAIHASTAAGKATQRVLGSDLMESWAAFVPPRLLGRSIAAWGALRLANHVPPPLNLIVSNVPGPNEPLFLGGRQLLAIYSVGPVLEGIGLNVTAWSYLDALHVSLLAGRAQVPEPHQLAAGMHRALAALT